MTAVTFLYFPFLLALASDQFVRTLLLWTLVIARSHMFFLLFALCTMYIAICFFVRSKSCYDAENLVHNLSWSI